MTAQAGGGNQDLFGSIMVVRFGAAGDFLEPTFDYPDGAGTCNLQFGSRAGRDATVIPEPEVLGIAEK
ncbi:MAG TPA: hypothetical protein DCK93_16385 [Blastocatellia bacterium]|nr:hypothetical protein [Blastocatellia bacterium]